MKRGYSHLLASALSLRAAGLATVLSHRNAASPPVEGRPHCVRQSLASTLLALAVTATLYCHPGRHASVVTPCLFTPCLITAAR